MVLNTRAVAGRVALGALIFLVAFLVAATPLLAQARGVLRGRVDVRHLVSPSRSTGDALASNSPDPAAPAPYRQAVVYFETAPEPLEPGAVSHVQMHQREQTFVPHLLAVTTGSTVDFPNDDITYHNVFSLSKTRRFDLGRYATGKSKAVRFDTAGIVRVFCDIHSQMSAFILVFPHRFFAVTDDTGRFRIERIPPGTYQVTAWYEGVSKQTQQVTIAPGGVTDATFVVK